MDSIRPLSLFLVGAEAIRRGVPMDGSVDRAESPAAMSSQRDVSWTRGAGLFTPRMQRGAGSCSDLPGLQVTTGAASKPGLSL